MSPLIRNPYPDINRLEETADAPPRHLWLEATSRCNTRCKTCPHFYETFGMDMSEEVVRKVREGVLDGVKSVDLIGCGEPFIARHWESLFKLCSEKNVKIDITTNGIRLADQDLVRRLVRANVVLAFSCDGARKETYEFVRPLIKWENTVAALESLKRHAAEAGREKRFALRINFVAMRKNIADLPDLVRLAKKYGAKSIFVMQLAYGESLPELPGQSLHDAPELVRRPMLQALLLGFLYGIHVSLPHRFREHILGIGGGRLARLKRAPLLAFLGLTALRSKGLKRCLEMLLFGFGPRSKYSKTFCSSPWQDSFIGSNGMVHPCCVDHPLGDLNTQSFKEIWNGAAYRNLRRTIHSWNPTRVCRFCELSKGLNGGDRDQYTRYFERFRSEAVSLEAIEAGEGCHAVEYGTDGAPSHRWVERRCRFSLRAPRGAKFLRLRIMPLAPQQQVNPGLCTIGGGPAEPFDNTCDTVHFPLEQAPNERIEVELSMDQEFHVAGDERALALAIRGVEFLSE